jgi:hypothetical protein
MDSRTDFDEDERFFDSYDAERAAAEDSLRALESEAAEGDHPTDEQLAHRARFRKPVAWVVAGLGLFSLLALEEHGAQQHTAQRQLVAHYNASLPAPAAPATNAQILDYSGAARLLDQVFCETDPVPGAPADDASVSAAFVSMLTRMCVAEGSDVAVDASIDTNNAPDRAGFALEDRAPATSSTCRVHTGKLSLHGPFRFR